MVDAATKGVNRIDQLNSIKIILKSLVEKLRIDRSNTFSIIDTMEHMKIDLSEYNKGQLEGNKTAITNIIDWITDELKENDIDINNDFLEGEK